MFRIFAQMMITHTRNSWNISDWSVCRTRAQNISGWRTIQNDMHGIVFFSFAFYVFVTPSEIKMRSQSTKMPRFGRETRDRKRKKENAEIVKISLRLISLFSLCTEERPQSAHCAHLTSHREHMHKPCYDCVFVSSMALCALDFHFGSNWNRMHFQFFFLFFRCAQTMSIHHQLRNN